MAEGRESIFWFISEPVIEEVGAIVRIDRLCKIEGQEKAEERIKKCVGLLLLLMRRSGSFLPRQGNKLFGCDWGLQTKT